jgi:hypothetical protein
MDCDLLMDTCPPHIARIIRIMDDTATGVGLADEDAAYLSAALERWKDGASLEDALELPPKSRQTVRREMAIRSLRPLSDDLPRLNRNVSIYEAGEYRSNRKRGVVPPGDRGIYHEFLSAYGRTPSLRTLQRLFRK